LKQANPEMTLNSIPQSLLPTFLCCFNPATSKDSTVFNCGPSVQFVTFRGSVIWVSATIRDTLPSSIVPSNLLPLYKLLFTKKLSDVSGRAFLKNLTQFLIKIVTFSGETPTMFESIHDFHLHSGFLSSVLPIYFPDIFMMDLSELFQPLTL
jgi:hypothetical protein